MLELGRVLQLKRKHNAISVRRSMKFGRFIQLLGSAAIVILCSSCEELPSYVEHPLAAFAPQPSGYWNGDGVSGSPKIVVRVGEQRAYF